MVKATGAGVAQERFRRIISPIVRRLWNFETNGFERLPADGPAILCPNHISFIDSVFLPLLAGRNVSFVGKAEYMDSWKTKHLFPMLGMIPIDRKGGSAAMAALETAAEVVRRGELFGIYPEGTRSRDGKLHKGRTGAARLSIETGAPIYPIGIKGTDLALPADSVRPRFGHTITFSVGRPVRPQRYGAMPERHRALRAMTDEVMFEISQLTGLEYVNTYAGKSSEAEGESRTAAQPAHVHEERPAVEALPERDLATASV